MSENLSEKTEKCLCTKNKKVHYLTVKYTKVLQSADKYNNIYSFPK